MRLMSRVRAAAPRDAYELGDKWLQKELEEIARDLRSRPPLRRGPFVIDEPERAVKKSAQSKKG
jgi:hypothetical protein